MQRVQLEQDETRESELIRLHGEQRQTRSDEVFGGLSAAERKAYDKNEDRIHELELNLPSEVCLSLLNRPLTEST
jgi:hypothetical protein